MAYSQNSPAPPAPKEPEEWGFNFCGCLQDIDTCLVSTAPCLAQGITRERFNGTHWASSTVLASYGYGLSLATCCPCFHACIPCLWRGEMRNRYNIKGSAFTDFLAHCFCSCCATAQEAREVMRREGYAPRGGALPEFLSKQAAGPLAKLDSLAVSTGSKAGQALDPHIKAAEAKATEQYAAYSAGRNQQQPPAVAMSPPVQQTMGYPQQPTYPYPPPPNTRSSAPHGNRIGI
eukprot:CAMPEP_0184657364 /NCGR_PEP_ID=MMETSP0308-20130426/19045_1 /TAXON_ID=38269 /ORGANISM="Gloeochaete witrockiana, Strain SAG 46.84" /LENGTH=232 /DNA_ID=CAMNT_0027095121 /DNA_START=99 /DNA_END=797 /DNA_ORIENTATION=-